MSAILQDGRPLLSVNDPNHEAADIAVRQEQAYLASEKIQCAEWWNERLEGINGLSDEVPTQLARCMRNLKQACRGDRNSLDAITTALSILERMAKADAMDENV